MGQRIPSPEEIASMLEERARFPELPPGEFVFKKDVEILKAKNTDKVETLEREIKKRRTPVELREAMLNLMEKYDFSPAEELVKMVTRKNNGGAYSLDVEEGSKRLRVQILETLLEYTLPKLKSMEITGQVDHHHEITIVRYGPDGHINKEAFKTPGPMREIVSPVMPVEVEVTRG